MLRLLSAFSLFKTIFLAHPSVEDTIGAVVELKDRLRSIVETVKWNCKV